MGRLIAQMFSTFPLWGCLFIMRHDLLKIECLTLSWGHWPLLSTGQCTNAGSICKSDVPVCWCGNISFLVKTAIWNQETVQIFLSQCVQKALPDKETCPMQAIWSVCEISAESLIESQIKCDQTALDVKGNHIEACRHNQLCIYFKSSAGPLYCVTYFLPISYRYILSEPQGKHCMGFRSMVISMISVDLLNLYWLYFFLLLRFLLFGFICGTINYCPCLLWPISFSRCQW